MIAIRQETPEEYDLVRHLHDCAFGQTTEGRLVEKLRQAEAEILSLVAVAENQVVGHLLFSTVNLETQGSLTVGMGLGPIAVLPDFQNQGIGSQLILEGLKQVQSRGYPFVIVLGHAHYYHRFGFVSASQFGLKCQWDNIPDEAFMALIFDQETMKQVEGVVKYQPAFDEVLY